MIANRYDVQDTIGMGGAGVVYRALDRLTREVVAIKQMNVALSREQVDSDAPGGDVGQALALEYRALAGLRHPNIVAVLDYGVDRNRFPYLVMQLIENGQSITEYGAELDFEGKRDLVVQMLQALVYLHRRGMVHHDLKPSNVLVTEDGTVKVMDFGLAVNQRLSFTGDHQGLAGTVAYMAPELFHNLPATVQTDLFAVGVIAFELFAGRYPYEYNNTAMLIYSILTNTPDMSGIDERFVPVLGALLAKEADDRYRSAQDAISALYAATSQSPPDESALVRESFLQASEFVGREQEIGTLKRALNDILVGSSTFRPRSTNESDQPHGSAWLIGGESGIGKSRLIDELRIRAIMRGALVLRGQTEMGGSLPYGLLREPLRRLALMPDLDDADAGVLKELVPDIADLLGRDVPDVPVLDGPERQQRLIATIVRVFLQQTQPMVLIVEDLQWATDSMELLRTLAHMVPDVPLLIVGSYRDDDAPDLPDRLPDMQVMKLRRLSRESIEALSRSMLGIAGEQPDVVRFLHHETEGNAFFMIEVVRALAEDAGSLDDIGRMTLPETALVGGIEEVVRRRLGRVPEWAQPLLKLAAVIGRQIDLDLLRTVIERDVSDGDYPSPEALDDWLTACGDAAVIEVFDCCWQFSHDKLREALLTDLPESERPHLHRLAAEAIEYAFPGDRSWSGVLLEHWRRAGDIDRELAYLDVVADKLVHVSSDFDHARELLDRTLAKLAADDPRRVMPLVYLSETHWRVDYEAGAAIAREALDLARQFNDRRGLAQGLQALGMMLRDQGQYETAEDLHRESLSVFEELGDERGVANNLNILGIIYHDMGQYEQAKAHYDQSLVMFREAGDEGRIGSTYTLLGVMAHDLGDYAGAESWLQQGLAIARTIGHRQGIGLSLNNLGVTTSEQGRYEEAKAYFSESIGVNLEIDNRWGVANNWINLGFVHIQCGEYDHAAESLYHGLRIASAAGATNLMLEGVVKTGWLLARRGELLRAAEIAGLAQSFPAGNVDMLKRLVPLITHLQETLDAAELEAALDRGRAQEIGAVVADLLEDLQP
jgi:serine/threonine protein kinase/tetratricopeptide (TPR) repeat protein